MACPMDGIMSDDRKRVSSPPRQPAAKRPCVPSAGIHAVMAAARQKPPSLVGRVLDICVTGFETKTITQRNYDSAPGARATAVGQRTDLVVFGTTQEHYSVAVRVPIPEAPPYIMCAAPPHWTRAHVARFRDWLEAECARASYRPALDGVARILDADIVDDTFSFCGFHAPGAVSRMVRITFSGHRYTFIARDVLCALRTAKDHARWSAAETRDLCRVFDAFSDFTMVASVNTGISLGSWYRLRMVATYKRDYPHADGETVLRSVRDLQPLQKTDPPPWRVLSWDIECYDTTSVGGTNAFPDASEENWPIGVISTACDDARVTFVLGAVAEAQTPYGSVLSFHTERELIAAFVAYVQHVNPTIVTGWNSNKFDAAYLVERAERWNVPVELGYSTSALQVKTSVFMSKQAGMRDNTRVTGTSGVFFIDLMGYFRTFYNLSSYALNSVAEQFLGANKLDMDYSRIPQLMRFPEGRNAVAKYCMRDAELPLELMAKMRVVSRISASAAFVGMPVDAMAGQTGQRKMAMASFYRRLRQRAQKLRAAGEAFRDYVLPYVPFGSGPEGKYKGALVLEPVVGYYEQPVGVLDFASLYPSIMRWKRMSPETLVPGGRRAAQKLSRSLAAAGVGHEVVVIDGMDEDNNDAPGPDDTAFVIVDGSDPITPALLADYAAERKRYKRLRNTFPVESPEWFLFEGFQIAVKVQMNSFYGTFGAELFWGTRAISEAVTLEGRRAIMQARTSVHSLAHNYAADDISDIRVLYGDTDSVMFLFESASGEPVPVPTAARVSAHLGRVITETLYPANGPMDLEFEKVFAHFALLKRKRYAALRHEGAGDTAVISTQIKGLGRRDVTGWVSDLQKDIIDTLVQDTSLSHACRITAIARVVSRAFEALKAGRVPLHKLKLTCSINKELDAYPPGTPHIRFARRLQAEGIVIGKGHRVAFVKALFPQTPQDRSAQRGALRTDTLHKGDYYVRPQDVYAGAQPVALDLQHYLDGAASMVRQIMTVPCGSVRAVDALCLPPALLAAPIVHSIPLSSPLSAFVTVAHTRKCAGCGVKVAGDAPLCAPCSRPAKRVAIVGRTRRQLMVAAVQQHWIEVTCGKCWNNEAVPLKDADWICTSPTCNVLLQRRQGSHNCARLCKLQRELDW
jgi:DNA polymerase elongation subunit (family B)